MSKVGQAKWLTPLIPATQKADIGGAKNQPGQKP
jgi:hypothetical protein